MGINNLIKPDANLFFGQRCALDSPTLETMLRYIELKHNSDNLEALERIKVIYTYSRGGVGDSFETMAGKTLYVARVERGYELPSIVKDGWEPLDSAPFPVAPFLSKASETRVYINKNEQKTAVFVKNITEKWLLLFCSTLSKILHWIYTDDTPASDEEIAIFRLLGQKTFSESRFTEIINEATKEYDFGEIVRKQTLLNWSSRVVNTEIQRLTQQANNTRDDIQEREKTISAQYRVLANLLERISSLEVSLSKEDTELYQFFRNHRELKMWKTRENQLYFTILTTLEYFDEEQFNLIYNNKNSCLHQDPGLARFFWGIFGEGKGKIRVESNFYLTDLSTLDVVKCARTGAYNDDYLPHPHQYHHGCLGSNGNYIRQYMSRGDWDMAIEQAIASVKNINFGDSVVTREFAADVYNSTCKCVIAENGEEMTVKEFLEYLKEQDKKEGNNNG